MIAEGRGQMPGGGTGTTVMTLGYDSARQRFVGTFIASMMTHLWVYKGVLNDAGTELTLETEGPVVVDVRVTREENTYPMIPAGAAAREMVG